jgi:hypothetical protein
MKKLWVGVTQVGAVLSAKVDHLDSFFLMMVTSPLPEDLWKVGYATLGGARWR